MGSKSPWLARGAVALLVGFVSGQGLACSGCPDLAYRAFTFTLDGADPGEVLYTVTDEATGEVKCAATAVSESCIVKSGIYTMSFEQGGAGFGELTGVCTAGDVSGCEAEDAEAKGQPPLIHVVHDATGWSASLESQGVCP